MHHDQIIKGLKALDLSKIKTRGEAGKLGWRINLPVLASKIEEIIEEIYFDTIDVPTLFIRGELSNYILESDFEDIKRKFPNSKIVTINNAGHWVHAEQQELCYQTVTNFLKKN